MNIHQELTKVTGRSEFVAFVYRLTEDLERNAEDWSNLSLKDYLLSIASWVEDGASEQREEDNVLPKAPSPHRAEVEWERLAFLLYAAGRYE